jgi:pyruvate/2-oxoglutarate dehydrogenase complex dihydrolipoamide dehydrogenase (E3) component
VSVDTTEHFRAVVIGSGQGGNPLAIALAKAGWRTAIIEREHVSGTCINEGCTPTKTMVASARSAYAARRAADYGVVTGPVKVDMQAVRRRKRAIVESWRASGERRLTGTPGLDLIYGEAAFAGPHLVEVRPVPGAAGATTCFLQADNVFVNAGARPAIPALSGLDSVPYLTSTTVMELEDVPGRLLVLGGGYVAIEFGQMFRRFGSEVTIVQRHDSLLPREDVDVADAVAAILREDGIELVLEAQATGVETGADGRVALAVATPQGTRVLTGSHLLVATGRVPNTERLNLAAAGLEADRHGYLPVDERLETKVRGIYALGDIKGGPAFTHISYDDFRILRTNLLEGGNATTVNRLVPYTVFMDPQLGRVGLTEKEARAQGLDVRVARMPMDWVARALEVDESRGLMKAVVDAASDRVLGCAVLGIEGGETAALLQLAMMGELTASTLRETTFAHPTLSESLNNLFASWVVD